MIKVWTAAEDEVVAAIIRRGPAPAGCWAALGVITGHSEGSCRRRAQVLRAAGPRPANRLPAGRPPTKVAAPAPTPAPRPRWWAPWRSLKAIKSPGLKRAGAELSSDVF